MPTLDTSGRVLIGRNPEEPENWSARITRTTLVITTFSLMLGFTVWLLPSVVAPRLDDVGFRLTKNQIYRIISMPGLSCAVLRLTYMLLPTTIGARKMTGWSSLLYIPPMLGWLSAVQNRNTSFGVLLVLSSTCGIGAATFSGCMPSTGFYFPKCLAGTVLGLQGGLGNMGMSVIQLTALLPMSTSLFGLTWVASHHEDAPMVVNAIVFFLPRSLAAAFPIFRYTKDVPFKANIKEQMDIFGNLDTRLMTVLCIMAFGVFFGFVAQTANIIDNNYGATSGLAEHFVKDDLPQGASYAFIGTFIDSFLHFAWGSLCDRFGGAIWTSVSTIGTAVMMVWRGYLVSAADDPADFIIFMVALLAMFFFVGVGNASTSKQMLMTMSKRQTGGIIGFIIAVTSLGPFLVGIALTLMPTHVFFYSCVVLCVVCVVTCWICYAKPGAKCPG